MLSINLFTKLACVGFFTFICWIILQADAGAPNIFIDLAAAIPAGDKLGHFWIYGTLAFMLNFAWRDSALRPMDLCLGSFCVLVFSLAEEASQGFFPSRTLDAGDVLADLLGVYVATWLSSRKFTSVSSAG